MSVGQAPTYLGQEVGTTCSSSASLPAGSHWPRRKLPDAAPQCQQSEDIASIEVIGDREKVWCVGSGVPGYVSIVERRLL
jgi:hypothetical protein